MQKNKIILVGLALLALLGIVLLNNKSTLKKEKPVVEAANNPWVEVLKPSAVVTRLDGTTSSLQTGDEVETGDVVKTDANGLANIYFPDGSVIRIDVGTELTITQAEYDLQNQKLVVKLFVNLGRVWSKIVKLSTPDSVWEVNTANAVATVRGTAFGVEFAGGETSVIGSENNVGVRLRDPNTLVLSKEEIIVSPNKLLRTSDVIAVDVVAGKVNLGRFIYSAPNSFLNRAWIKRARARDLELNKILNSFGTSTLNVERAIEVRKAIIENKINVQTAPVEPAVKPITGIITNVGSITISTTNDFTISPVTTSNQDLNTSIR